MLRDHLVAAVLALIHVAALIGSTAGLDRPHGAMTIQGHGMSAPVKRTVLAEDIRDLKLSGFSRTHDEETVK